MSEIKRFSSEYLDKAIEEEIESKLNIDFDELLETRKKFLNINLIDEDNIKKILSEADEKLIREGWIRVVERISSETKALDTLKEFDFIYNLIRGLQSNKTKTGLEIQFVPQLKADGTFLPFLSKIKIKEKLPSREEIWLNLAISGTPLCGSLRALKHELVHSLQWTKARKRKELFKEYIIAFSFFLPSLCSKLKKQERFSRILDEVQAFKSVLDINSAIELIVRIASNYGYFSAREIDALITAVIEIDRLKALGLTEKRIANLVGRAKWDEKTASFPLLEKEINKLAEKKSLEIEDVDNLVLAKRIEREIELQKARIIAQEELIKLQDKNQKSNFS